MPDKTPLRDFLNLIESQLESPGLDIATEPVELDDCSVVSVAPVQGGFVGLDLETGKPVPTSWKYKAIHEKPVIINTGNKQTIIPPAPPPPDEPLPPIVTSAMAGQLFEDMRAKLKYGAYMTAKDVETKNCFVVGCLANPSFYIKWRSILDALAPVSEPAAEPEPAGWPRPPQIRQRIVDT